MPCNQDSERCNDNKIGSGWTDEKVEIHKLKERNKHLEAVLCALFNELEDDGSIERFMALAVVNGKTNISDFWVEHQQKDLDRMEAELIKYSEHERRLLKKILNKS